MQQERHIVFFDREVALVDVGRKRKRVEFFGLQQRTRRIVDYLAVFDVADVCDSGDGLAVRIVHHGVVEFSAHDEINIGAGEKAFRRLDLHLRADEANFDSGLLFLHGFGHAKVAVETHGGGEENDELVVFRDFNHLRRGDAVRRTIQETATGQLTSRISEPDRVPVGFDFACSGPARPGAAVKVLEARRIQQQRFHYRRHSQSPRMQTVVQTQK